jgi:hypothetical protein
MQPVRCNKEVYGGSRGVGRETKNIVGDKRRDCSYRTAAVVVVVVVVVL